MLTTVAVSGYRSLRDICLPLGRLVVVTGANGSGKSNVYRAMRLLANCADGAVIGAVAREGGLHSILWAGPEDLRVLRRGAGPLQGTVRTQPVSLRMGYATDDGFGYLIDLGQPVGGGPFARDPEIKRELVWHGPVARPAAVLVDRGGPLAQSGGAGGRSRLSMRLRGDQSMLTELADPARAPELLAVREQIRSWRFYDSFRTDVDSPVRQAQIGTRTPVLAGDGTDLAAALATIIEVGDAAELQRTMSDAFDGAEVQVGVRDGRFEAALRQPGMLRPLRAAELSDGTLRYLLLAAALLTPRPPDLMVLNEPETSLHPDLMPALGRLIADAARRSQLIVVTHADHLVTAIEHACQRGDPPAAPPATVRLVKDHGETLVAGQGRLDAPAWHWGGR